VKPGGWKRHVLNAARQARPACAFKLTARPRPSNASRRPATSTTHTSSLTITAPPASTYPLTILVVQAAIQALIRSAAAYLSTTQGHEPTLPRRCHRAAARSTTTRFYPVPLRDCWSTPPVSLRHDTTVIHADRGWCSCTREEDFAGQNLLLPETRVTHHQTHPQQTAHAR
jgi:hypothetical protein